MNIDDLAFLLGKTKKEVEGMLKEKDIIELNLTEKNKSKLKEEGEIKVIE